MSKLLSKFYIKIYFTQNLLNFIALYLKYFNYLCWRKNLNFRYDIQILRGVSVLFVVLFHLGFSSLKSGFLGVDVFFVISGFLMAVLYDHRNKKDFFARRAKRLLPPYFFVIILTVLVSFFVNTPNETKQVVEQSIFGAFFIPNVGYWLQNSYFSKAEFNPLLHLWSLGVEIQFYIFIPLLSLFFRKSRYFLPLIALFSLILCFVVLTISPKTSFFMLPFRVWEFLIGFGVAKFFSSNGSVKYKGKEFIGLASLLILILIPFMSVDGESLNVVYGHPGLYAILVCLATSCVLLFGLPSRLEHSALGNTLVWFGKYSYSIYLVHFPIIVLFLSKPFGGTIVTTDSLVQLVVIILLIGFFSYISYNFVEKIRFKKILVPVFFGSLISILLPLLLSSLQSGILEDNEKKIFGAFSDRSQYRCGKIIRILNPKAISCDINSIDNPDAIIMLVGNSHSDSIKTIFSNVSSENNARLIFLVPNNPLMTGGISVSRVINEAVSKNVDHIVIHFSTMGFPIDNVLSLSDLAIKKGIKVTIIEPVPIWNKHIPKYMYDSLNDNDSGLVKKNVEYNYENREILKGLDTLQLNGVERMSVVDVFCKDECAFSSKDGKPFYFDSNHLTLTGSKELEGKFRSIFNQS
ncbi:MAG: acyltransferase [Algicola sp.]|nr:acyltransferase [Algicola sp.]